VLKTLVKLMKSPGESSLEEIMLGENEEESSELVRFNSTVFLDWHLMFHW